MSYNTKYIDIPHLKITAPSGGKAKKMAKTTNNTEAKTSKKYAKTRGEHYKDIVIAILVTAIVAFIAGLQFANSNNAKIQAAVDAVTPTATAAEVSK